MIQRSRPVSRRAGSLFGSLLPLMMLFGCSALQIDGSVVPPAADPAAVESVAAEQPASPQLKLEIRAAGKNPVFRQVALQQGMCIQDALKQARLTRRFRRMDVQLIRSTAEGAAKLDSKYDHKANRVDPLYDYALYNGDHLIVIEDTSNVLDDLLNALPSLGPGRGR